MTDGKTPAMTTEALTAIKEALVAGPAGWANPRGANPKTLYAFEASDISALISSYEEMERRIAELEEALNAIPEELWGLTAKKSQEGKKAAAINIRTAAKIADQISSRALSPAGEAK